MLRPFILLLSSTLLAAVAAASAAERPNIVLIMVDDMGFSDIGCYGGEIETPNIDSLAAGGVRFTQFYNAARCCPTRASLLTGLYPHQAGIGFMEPGNKYNVPIKDIPEYQGFLNDQCVTLAEVLKDAGYQTFMSGKWHVGARQGQRPPDRGFDRFFGLHAGASKFFTPLKGKLFLDRETWTDYPDDFYTTDYFAKFAAQFVQESNPDEPFFLYLAFTAPHWPLHAWPKDIEKYRGKYKIGWDELRRRRFAKQKELGLFNDSVQLSPRHKDAHPWEEEPDQDDMDHRMAIYAAMIDSADQGIGLVLDAVRARGDFDNTLVVFLNDNGACAEPVGMKNLDDEPLGHPESYQAYFISWANAGNTPFRLYKHWAHEGGIATPFIAHWPARIQEGGAINHDQIGHVKDVMATFLDAAGAEYPASRNGKPILPTEGHSLLPAMIDPSFAENRPVYWEHEGNRALRDGDWKLVSYYNDVHEDMQGVGTGPRTGPWELYNLADDRTELTNLATKQPERLQEMLNRYQAWEQRLNILDWEDALRRGGYHQ